MGTRKFKIDMYVHVCQRQVHIMRPEQLNIFKDYY